MDIEARAAVAPGNLPTYADGVPAPPTVGKNGEVYVSDLLPKYTEAVLRGLVFVGSTATSGVAPGTVIGTTSPFTLANPAGSGKILIPLRVSCAYVSGTLGTGTSYYVANTNPIAAAVSGTPITVLKAKFGVNSSTTQGNSGQLFTTATLPASPTLVRPIISLTPVLASSVVAPYLLFNDDVAGEFAVDPGCALSVESVAAAGTSPLVVFGMSWMEVSA